MKITRKKFLVFNTISPMLIFNKIVSLFILLVCVTLCLVSCDKKQKRSEPQIGLNNYYLTPGTDLTTDYKRIASVSPQVTEMLCALGCKDRLLCRTDFCNFPKDIKNMHGFTCLPVMMLQIQQLNIHFLFFFTDTDRMKTPGVFQTMEMEERLKVTWTAV